MIKLDKTKVYDLSGLNEEQFNILNSNLVKLKDAHWRSMTFKYLKEECCYVLYWINNAGWCLTDMHDSPTTDAIELFYTLENVQVDCRGLSEFQIDNLKNNMSKYNIGELNDSFDLESDCIFFSFNQHFNIFGFYEYDNEQYNISYDKFIELFSNKEFKELNLHNIAVNVLDCDKKQLEIAISIFKKNNLNIDIIRMPYTRRKGFLISAVKDLGKINYVKISYDKFIELFGNTNEQNFKDLGIAKVDFEEFRKYNLEKIKELMGGTMQTLVEKARKSYGETEHSKRVPTFQETFNPQPHYDNTNFQTITDSIASLLEYKNEKYGNSALEPLNIFSNKCKTGQRLDDKLARIKNADQLKKNDVADLIGYLILTCKENNWTNFDEFKD